MAVTNSDLDLREGGARDRLARALGVVSALYGLLALITGAVAAFGLRTGEASGQAAQLLALPWSLAAGPAAGADPVGHLAVVLGGLMANLLLLVVGSRLARGRLRNG